MDVELHLTSLDPPQGEAHLGGGDETRVFVGWLGLLHLLWELFGAGDAAEPGQLGVVNLETPR